MQIEYPLLNPQTLEPDPNGQRYRKTTTDSGAVIYAFWYENETILSYDPNVKKVTATILDYAGNFAANYSGQITFNCDGTETNVNASNGFAILDTSALAAGSHIIRTDNPDMRNGQIAFIIG